MKTFFELLENIKSADRKPEVYTKPDGKKGTRMVPVDREVIKQEKTLEWLKSALAREAKATKPRQDDMEEQTEATMYCKDCGCEKGNPDPNCTCPNDNAKLTDAQCTSEQSKCKSRKEDKEEMAEGPFKGVGKMMMKRKLNKQYKKSDLANFDKSGISTKGKTPDEVGQKKSDYYHGHMDKAARAKKAMNRLSRKEGVNELTIADVQKATAMAKKRQEKEREAGKKSVSTADLAARMPKKETFEPHMMYDPKTGKGYKADKEDDHLRMKKMGYTHDKPTNEAHDPKHVKQAVGIASDPRYKGGNMTGATKVINKLSKGLSDHPQVKAVLKRQNEGLKTFAEISKGMAGRYIKKAQVSTADAAKSTERGYTDSRSPDRDIAKAGSNQAKKGIKTFINRNKGTSTAVDKLTGKAKVPAKEGNVSEISNNKMGQYVRKAAGDAAKKGAAGDTDKAKARVKGVSKAMDKMDKNRLFGRS
tara:strand:- start:1533 stop:2957 length:1425 start_codon:yes stop_codon:yes gene_type:complete